MSAELRSEGLEAWIGRSQTVHDNITGFPIRALCATLDIRHAAVAQGTPVPPLWHWLYFLPVHRPHQMRRDGHAHGGEFMPPIPLPRRVWAGSKFTWATDNPLRVGDRAMRISRIDAITPKEGSAGKLVFVKVIHEVYNERGLSLVNEHTAAFREAAKSEQASSQPVVADTNGAWHRELMSDPVLLFRYSALTFNAHRIHYDHPYATGEESYPALLVQGPLIATLLIDLLHRSASRSMVRNFELKAVRPSYVGRPLHLRGDPDGSKVRLWAADEEGYLTMTATAEVEQHP